MVHSGRGWAIAMSHLLGIQLPAGSGAGRVSWRRPAVSMALPWWVKLATLPPWGVDTKQTWVVVNPSQ